MPNEKTPVVWDDTTKKHRPLGTGEKMGGLDASSIISSDSGNLIQTGSDGLALVTGSSLADPRADNLLETSAGGKLQVTSDRIAEWISAHPDAAGSLAAAFADGETIVASGGKLVVDPSTAPKAKLSKISTALRKAGAGLAVDASTGKLVVDFASMDPAIMRAVVLSMVQQGGGIGVDANGQLYVDFDSMPTDKFEAMLKSLKMLVPLDRALSVYVDINSGSDTLDSGRGLSAAKPFKHIQNAVNFVTSTYSLGNYNVYISVGAGTYPESVTLPSYSRGTGSIYIRSSSGARDVTVVSQLNSLGMRTFTFSVSGGNWILQHLAAVRVENPTTQRSAVGGCFSVNGSGSTLHIRGCSANQSFPAEPSPLGGNAYDIRIFTADSGGTLFIEHDVLSTAVTTHTDTAGGHSVDVFLIARSSQMWLPNAYDEDYNPPTTGVVLCSGSCTRFIRVTGNSDVFGSGGGNPISFSGDGVTGKRFQVEQCGRIQLGRGLDWFPGDVAGTVDNGEDGRPQTFCIYS